MEVTQTPRNIKNPNLVAHCGRGGRNLCCFSVHETPQVSRSWKLVVLQCWIKWTGPSLHRSFHWALKALITASSIFRMEETGLTLTVKPTPLETIFVCLRNMGTIRLRDKSRGCSPLWLASIFRRLILSGLARLFMVPTLTKRGFLDSKLENQETGHKSRKLMLFSVLKVTVDF